jgi:hypothetical protein
MLSVSSKDYELPIKAEDQGGWLLVDKRNPEIFTFAKQFNFTLFGEQASGDRARERFTFAYDGASVKPTGRCIRILGADRTSKIVSQLSQNTDHKSPSELKMS